MVELRMTFGIDQDPRTNVKYSDELAHVIVEKIRDGVSVKKICAELDITLSTFFNWRRENPTFCKLYDHAREDQVRLMVDEIAEIADDSAKDWTIGKNGEDKVNTEVVQRSRLRIESRKWLATVFAPKDFAPKQNGEGNDNTLNIVVKNNIDG